MRAVLSRKWIPHPLGLVPLVIPLTIHRNVRSQEARGKLRNSRGKRRFFFITRRSSSKPCLGDAEARDDPRRSVSARWYRSRDNRSKLDQTHQTAEIGSKRSSFFCTADRGARAARRAENCNPTPTVTENIFRPRHQLPIYLKNTIAPASELRRRIRTAMEDITHDAVSIFEPPYTLSRRSGRRSRRRSSGRKNVSLCETTRFVVRCLSSSVYEYFTSLEFPRRTFRRSCQRRSRRQKCSPERLDRPWLPDNVTRRSERFLQNGTSARDLLRNAEVAADGITVLLTGRRRAENRLRRRPPYVSLDLGNVQTVASMCIACVNK